MQQFKGKKVAVLGLSVEGLDSVRFFIEQGAQVVCCDRRTKKQLGSTYTHLSGSKAAFQLGNTYLSDLASADLVVRTQGMALWLPELVEVRKTGKLTSNTKLFFSLCRAPIIGVTGTKGKGTTATLIYEMLKAQGKTVFLGGNVGTPLLSRVQTIKPRDWVVLELSSFQLEDLDCSPHVAVVLRITQDHLANYDPLATNYHPSRQDYVVAKKSIVRFQTEHDVAVFNADDPTSRSFAHDTPAKKYYFSRTGKGRADAWVENQAVYVRWNRTTQRICSLSEIILRGEHNLENIAAASIAALVAGVDIATIRGVAKKFKGLEHRLEFVRRIGGVSYFDDSFSTVPETTIAAIQSFSEPITLIVGGSEKGSNFTELGEEIAKSTVKTLIVIGQMARRIIDAVKQAGFSGDIIGGRKNMKEIVSSAAGETPVGVVLLSPACASFDMFKNYKDRGNQFKHEVSSL